MTFDPYLSLVVRFDKAGDLRPDLDIEAQIQLRDVLLDSDLALHHGPLSLNASPPNYCLLTASFLFVLDGLITARLVQYHQIRGDQIEVKIGNDKAMIVKLSSDANPLVLRAGLTDLRLWADAFLSLIPIHHTVDASLSPSSSSQFASSHVSSLSFLGRAASPLCLKQFQVRARIFVMSWNMGAHTPDLTGELDLSPDYQIYVFGVQECPNGVLFRCLDRQMLAMGCYRQQVAEQHERIYGRGDGAILKPKFTGLIVYVRRAALAHVRIVRASSCPIGKGSKGAVAVVLDAFGISVAVICAHLSSTSVLKRRRDLAQIFLSLSTGLSLGDGRHFDLTDQFDHCIFFGDLNFRVAGVSVTDAVLALQTDAIGVLDDADELVQELAQDRSLFGFIEPRRRFLPTYKLNRDRPQRPDWSRADWPQRRYTLHFKGYWYKSWNQDPIRVPSWCDRILFTNGGCGTSLLIPKSDNRDSDADCYNIFANDVFIGSDHESIYAALDLLGSGSPDPIWTSTIAILRVTIHELNVGESMLTSGLIPIVAFRAMLRRSSLIPSASERFAYAALPCRVFCAAQSETDSVQLLLQVILKNGDRGSCSLVLTEADLDGDRADSARRRQYGPQSLSWAGTALRHPHTDALLSLTARISFTFQTIR